MSLRSEPLSPAHAPDLGNIAAYTFFEKIDPDFGGISVAMTPNISSSGITETPIWFLGRENFPKKKAASPRDINPAWFSAASLIRSFFATYNCTPWGHRVSKSKVMIRRKSTRSSRTPPDVELWYIACRHPTLRHFVLAMSPK